MPLTPDEAAEIITSIRRCIDPSIPRLVRGTTETRPATQAPVNKAPAVSEAAGDDASFERLYLRIKNRIIDEAHLDPVLLKILTTRPEIIIDVEPRVLELKGDSLRGRIGRLMAAGWFADKRDVGTVRRELARTGADPGGGGTLGAVLKEFQRDGFFVLEGSEFKMAPGVKVTDRALEVR